jgi:hypothetical protein
MLGIFRVFPAKFTIPGVDETFFHLDRGGGHDSRVLDGNIGLAARDGGDDGDFGVGREGSGEAAGVADVFVADEEVDVFADLALFSEDAVADAGVERVKSR